MPKEKGQRTNNDLQNITHKTKDLIIRTQLKTEGELMCSGRVRSSCSTSVSGIIFIRHAQIQKIGNSWEQENQTT